MCIFYTTISKYAITNHYSQSANNYIFPLPVSRFQTGLFAGSYHLTVTTAIYGGLLNLGSFCLSLPSPLVINICIFPTSYVPCTYSGNQP